MKSNADNDMLYKAVLSLETLEDCEAFFADLCTITEIKAMSQRLEVAKMLSQGKVYHTIVEKTGASSATVSRVNRSLNYGEGGYKKALGRLSV